MNAYTHYSLFDGVDTTLADFAPLPAGGLRELLADLHARCAKDERENCVACGPAGDDRAGVLHPGAEQVSFYVGRRFLVILFAREALEAQAVELRSEGNHAAASRASAPLLPKN